jgi:hypothetical protein
VINAGFSAGFGYSWTASKTVSQTTTVTVKPGKVAWIARSAAMQSVAGDLSVKYWTKVAGKYEWTVPGLTVNGPRDAPGNVVIQDRDMTAAEKAEVCRRNSVLVTTRRMDPGTAQHTTSAS